MAEDYKVKATLTADDKNFSKTFENAENAVTGLSGKLKSGISFGIFTGVGMKALDMVTQGISGMISELSSSNLAWKSFEGNMQIFGKSANEISSVKKELQDYATQTIYSASDMASTYAQLTATGVDGAEELVKGFGGIAAASENPKQALKTLSQQAVQMAAKPMVAWEDFKLMLEQTPAGIAGVAKEMGMTTQELVANVQNGTIATEDFFAAIEKVGNSEGFSNMAQDYKSVGQALDGLYETLANKLGPSFEIVTQAGIGFIEGVIDKVANWDTSGLEKGLTFLIDHADTFATAGKGLLIVAGAIKLMSIASKAAPLMDAFSKSIGKVSDTVTGGLSDKLFKTAKGQDAVGKSSSTSSKKIMTSAKAFVLMGAGVALIAAGFYLLASAATMVAESGGLAVGVLFGLVAAVIAIGAGFTIMLKTITATPKRIQTMAIALLSLGAAVLMVGAGFYILASAATMLADAGAPAIAIMVGMVVAIALLAAGAAAIGPALTAGAVGFVAFGAAIALVGVGALLAAVALQLVSGVLPTVSEYGASGAIAIAQLGLAMITFAAGAALAGAASIILGAGLIVVAAGAIASAAGALLLATAVTLLGAGIMLAVAGVMMLGAGLPLVASGGTAAGTALMLVGTAALLVATGSLAAAVGIAALGVASIAAGVGLTAFGVALTLASAGVLVLAGSLAMVNGTMGSIANRASEASSSLSAMVTSVNIVDNALNSLGSMAKSAMNDLISAFRDAEGEAKSAGKAIGDNVKNGVENGLRPLPNIASSTMSSVMSVLSSAGGSAYSSGYNIGAGMASGMYASLGAVTAAANALVAQAERAINAAAQIHSPSRLMEEKGEYFGEGWEVGIRNRFRQIRNASKAMVKASIPDISSSGQDLTLNADHDYSGVVYVNAEVTSVMDGRKVGYGSARYVEEKNNFDTKRKNRIGGVQTV